MHMVSNNGLHVCLRTAAQYMLLFLVYGSIIPTGFKFTESHTLTLAVRSYALFANHLVSMVAYHTADNIAV